MSALFVSSDWRILLSLLQFLAHLQDNSNDVNTLKQSSSVLRRALPHLKDGAL